MRPPRPGVWVLQSATAPLVADTEQLFAALHGGSDAPAFWLDSSRAAYGTGRWSLMGALEHELDHVVVLDAGAGVLRVRGAGEVSGEPSGASSRASSGELATATPGAALWDHLAERIAANPVDPGPHHLPFTGGYVGYVGYGAKDLGDTTRTDPSGRDAELLHVTRFVLVDHLEEVVHAVAVGPPGERAAALAWAEATARRVRAVTPNRPAPRPPARPGPVAGGGAPRPVAGSSVGAEEYLAALGRVRRWLLAGDSYEACYTHQLTFRSAEAPSEVHRRLRASNPAPYAAHLRLGGRDVLSSSPERFLHVTEGGWAETKPIKGTAARAHDPAEDAELARSLAADPKTRAENLMVVDLLRNDLGLVCDPGTVHVPELMAVETYATVHQLVTTVRGHLRPVPAAAVRAAQALFPGGSMTGAPKSRTVQLLDALEVAPRGVYSGVLGYFSRSGTADLSVVIRTAVVDDGHVTVGTGGAITIASDPAAERTETQVKARAVLDAFGVGHPFDAAAAAPATAPEAATRSSTGPSAPPAAGERWEWRDGSLRPVAPDAGFRDAGVREGATQDADGRVLVADSWRVQDGSVRGLELHRRRFLRAVPAPARADAGRFWDAVGASLPRDGAWFPRVECRDAPGGTDQDGADQDGADRGGAGVVLRYLARPDAAPRTVAVVVTHDGPDPRTVPAVKGPDLDALAVAVAAARRRGADEPALLSGEGHVVEAAWSALLWWREGRLHRPADDLTRVDSVTAALVQRVAEARGEVVHGVRARPQDLDGAELWLLNARHGLRVVTAWVDGPALVREPGRWERWNALLASTAAPLR